MKGFYTMKKNFVDKMRFNSLFFKVISIFVTSIVLVSILIATITIEMSKNSFVKTYSQSNEKVLTQIARNFSSLNDQIVSVLNRLSGNMIIEHYFSLKEPTPAEEFAAISQIQQYLKEVIPATNFANITILLAGIDGKTHVDNADFVDLDVDKLLDSPMTKNTILNSHTISYRYAQEFFTSNTKYDNSLVATKALLSSTREPYGTAYVILNQHMLESMYSHFIGSATGVSIIDSNNLIISCQDPTMIGRTVSDIYTKAQNLTPAQSLYYDEKVRGKDLSIIVKFMPGYNTCIVGTINKEKMLNEMYNSSEIVFVSLLIALGVTISSFIIIRRTTRPISLLAQKMPKIINGNFDNYIPVTGNYEVRQLAIAFNTMLDGLNSYMSRQMKMQNEKRQAEIHALQMQINPHFIYNTLASIKWLIWQGNKEKSIETIDAFIGLLRNTISNKSELIAVKEEIENLKNYVQINSVRHGEKISVNFFVFPDCEDYILPKLVLQPFVENAFFHGFQENKGDEHIRVFVKEFDGTLICEVMDDGVGMDGCTVISALKPEHNSQHFTGIGINNVNDRIKLLYGDSYGVTVTSQKGMGTTVKLTVPARKLEEQ